jgi:single-stranded-DNA-specific exonuclease
LLSYGGHYRAAGISIKEDDIDEFTGLLNEIIHNTVESTEPVFQTFIDSECQLLDINLNLINQMEMLAPFGCKNPEPILCARNINEAYQQRYVLRFHLV